MKRATLFAKTINNMDDQRWAKIIEAAKAYVGRRDPDRMDRAKVGAALLLNAASDSDDEILHDTMFDSRKQVGGSTVTAPGDQEPSVADGESEGSGLPGGAIAKAGEVPNGDRNTPLA